MLILTEAEIRDLASMQDAIISVESAFASLSQGRAQVPAVIHFDFPEGNGDAHVKGAYLSGSPSFVVKIASGFYDNPARGLAVGNGLVLAFDVETGQPQALLLDHGYLTDLRTGAAAGVSAKYLANEQLSKVAFVGAGVEARFSARGIATVRSLPPCQAWSRSFEHAEKFAQEMSDELGIRVTAVHEAEEAVRSADLVVTTTPSHDPIVKADWLSKGVHVIALGSDGPEKQELEVEVLALADSVIADRLSQCLEGGEIHHAVEAGVLSSRDIAGELGDVIVGATRGRTSLDDVTVCDLTGVGVQDAAVATLVITAAQNRGVGAAMPM